MGYEKIFEKLKKWYEGVDAPVVWLIKFQGSNPEKVLVSAILSTRTKDETTLAASEKLFKKINGLIDLRKLSIKEIERLIYPVGFYRTKAKHLKELSKIGKVPDNFDELIKLPGVGRKVASLYLTVVHNKDEICVDTHVHRISNRLGWVKSENPLGTEKALKLILPKNYWKSINYLFVALGQKICTPRTPKCSVCVINKYCKKVFI